MKDAILICDLHNTIYDEVMEYGGAMDAAIKTILTAGKTVDEATLCEQIGTAHATLGSDWDEDVFARLPCIRALPDAARVIAAAQKTRIETGAKLTRQYAYTETVAALRRFASEGARIYIATEATANAAADALRALDLDDGAIAAVYSWPYAKPFQKLAHTAMHNFPADPDNPGHSLEKPHPLIIGAIMLAEAKHRGLVNADVTADDVFALALDPKIDVAPLANLAKAGGAHSRQITDALTAIRTRMTIRPDYQSVFDPLWQNAFFIGDSFFKDGFLANNAAMRFVFAKYGKHVAETSRPAHERAMHVMVAVTGWDKTLLKLTQEAGHMPELLAAIKPHITCEKSVGELLIGA